MVVRRQISFQNKLNIVKEIDNGMKQVDATKKYGLASIYDCNFPEEEDVNSNEINSQRTRLKVSTNENIDAAWIGYS
ncbi:hypothetical protein AVEN_267704-1 [Araneus ventricosus]|uniref:HTH psq-type domain-containing protein n=1 Tax=Araneus ventricosus TaxID=182803 RepID=A0A4Y2CWG9_ARAVE|nr:hypothetical protein AVEN_267704-1 [Araneus ventricosus]